MEIKKILALLKKNYLYLLIFILAGAVIGGYLGKNYKDVPHAQLDVFISPKNVPKNQASDNYYLQEEARNFTDTVVVILESPDFAKEVTSQGQTISSSKLAPQVIRITASASSFPDAKILVLKAIEVFNHKIQNLNEEERALRLKPLTPIPGTFMPAVDTKVLIAAGALFGLLFAAFVISLRQYLNL